MNDEEIALVDRSAASDGSAHEEDDICEKKALETAAGAERARSPVSADETSSETRKDTRRGIDGLSADAILPVETPKRTFSLGIVGWILINTVATVGIVFINKEIFDNPNFRRLPIAFTAFHFLFTSLTLYFMQTGVVAAFEAKRLPLATILPLCWAFIGNVVLPNLSLTYSSILFYQLTRVLLSPATAAINFLLYNSTISRKSGFALLVVCIGVVILTLFDFRSQSNGLDPNRARLTTVTGALFAFSGVAASALYTVWIAVYHKRYHLSSMQLLYNQAPISVLLLLVLSPFLDVYPDFRSVTLYEWSLIVASGTLASCLNLSQFYVINGTSPVESTVVGHTKTCIIVALGWYAGKHAVSVFSLLGISLALVGIICYSKITMSEKDQSR